MQTYDMCKKKKFGKDMYVLSARTKLSWIKKLSFAFFVNEEFLISRRSISSITNNTFSTSTVKNANQTTSLLKMTDIILL